METTMATMMTLANSKDKSMSVTMLTISLTIARFNYSYGNNENQLQRNMMTLVTTSITRKLMKTITMKYLQTLTHDL